MPRVPVIGDIPPTSGAPGFDQGGPPAPTQGFGPRQRAKRLLRQGAGLQPASDVQPATGLNPAIEALFNLQLSAGLLPQQKFDELTRGPRVSEVAGTSAARRRPGQAVQPRRAATGPSRTPGLSSSIGPPIAGQTGTLSRIFSRRIF